MNSTNGGVATRQWKIFKRVCLVLATVLCTRANCHADALITSIVNQFPFDFGNTITVGYAFDVGNSPVLVTTLGMWDEGSDGLASAVDAGLWTNGGSLLGSVTIPAGTSATLINSFRYVNLPSNIVLGANTRYVVGAYRHPGVSYNAAGSSGPREGIDFITNAAFDVIQERASSQFGGELSMAYPGFAFDGDQALIGPNLLFTAVPEPASWLLAAMGGVVFCARRRAIRCDR